MDLFTADLERISIADLEDFLGLKDPIEKRPPEGLRIDYKLKEPDDFPDTVAAFANAYGGLVFIGVESKRQKHNLPISLPGVVFIAGDVRARITGKILSQVHPRPEISIGVVPIPPPNDRIVVVVRVAPALWPPCEFTRLDTVRIPMRIQDTNRQATLREIEQLFQKRTLLSDRVDQRTSAIDETQPLEPVFIEPVRDLELKRTPRAYQTWIIRPRLPSRLRLDRAFDHDVRAAISKHFQDPGNFYPPLMAGDSHIVHWQGRISNASLGTLTYARVFQFTSDGSIRYSERLDRHETSTESVSDLIIQSLLFLRFADEFYQSREYFGSFNVVQRIDCNSNITFVSNFPDASGNYIGTNVIVFSGAELGTATGSSRVLREVHDLRPEEKEELLLDFTLAHLRQLCQASVDYAGLRALMRKLPERTCIPFFS